MSEIKQNYPQQMPMQMQQYPQPQMYPQMYPQMQYPMGYQNMGYMMQPQRNVKDEFVHQHKKNGLIERLYNGIKNLTGLGVGSKKAEKAVEKAESGEISEEEARKTIENYRKSQHNSAQAVGDGVSILASLFTFFGLRKNQKIGMAKELINENYYKNRKRNTDDFLDLDLRRHKKQIKLSKSKPKQIMMLAGTAALVGAFTKYVLLKLNRIGSQDKVKKKDYNKLATPMDKAAYKHDKKARRREKRKESWHNFLSGGINGLTMPLAMIGGGIVGAPLYLATNLLNRYFVGNTVEENKSFKGFVDNLKQDGAAHALVAAGIAIPMVKKGRWNAAFEKNIDSAVKKLAPVELKLSKYKGQSTHDELRDMLLIEDRTICDLIHDAEYGRMPMDEAIQKLTEENIFALKFKQTSGDGSQLTNALKEDCPPTRCSKKEDGSWDFNNIQKFITDNLGNYKVEKCLGVGTVAETYLAKGPDGKEVCLKVLKEGISAEKIARDKQKFIDLIEKSGKSADEIEYLKKNIDDLADGILKEVDFNNELNAAKELEKHTKMAHVVKGLEVRNGIYVMEKANGISLESLMNLHAAYNYKKALESDGINHFFSTMLLEEFGGSRIERLIKQAREEGKDCLEVVDKEIARIKAKTPQFDDFELSNDEIKYLLNEYNQVLGEQLGKVDKNGKTIHADIHPGNIFIDLKALKSAVKKQNSVSQKLQETGYMQHMNGKIFTLIDTGNTIKQTADQAIGAINLTSYVDKGNYKDMATYLLDGAKLPEGMTKDEAYNFLSEELRKHFLDLETKIDYMTNDGVIDLASKIMRSKNIMPSDTQFNMNKARNSAETSLKEIRRALINSRFSDGFSMSNAAGTVSDVMSVKSAYKKELARQEKANLKQMTLEQRLKAKNNPNTPKNNSEDYWIYKLKQEKLTKTPIEEVPTGGGRNPGTGIDPDVGGNPGTGVNPRIGDDGFDLIGDDVIEHSYEDIKAEFNKYIKLLKETDIKEITKDIEKAFETGDTKDIEETWKYLHSQDDLTSWLITRYTGVEKELDFSDPNTKNKLIKAFEKIKEYSDYILM